MAVAASATVPVTVSVAESEPESESDARLPVDERIRVDLLAVAADLEVDVGAGCETRHSDGGDSLAAFDKVADLDQDFADVTVVCSQAATVVDDHEPPGGLALVIDQNTTDDTS